MEVTVIATMLIKLLLSYFEKAGEEIAGEVGQAAWVKATEVYQRIKSRFEKEDSQYSLEVLEQFKKKPEKRKAAMQEVLEEILTKDNAFTNSMIALLKDVQNSPVETTFNTNVSGGQVEEIINIDRLEGGLNINK